MVFELVPSVGVGLLIAYYGVWWIRGESAGLPRFDWLPFLPSEEYIARAPAKTTSPAKPVNALPAKPAPAVATPQPQATATSIAKNEPAANTVAPASTETAAKNEPVIEKTASDVASPGTLPSVAENKTPSATASNEPPPPKVGPRPPANFTSLDLDTAIQEATDAIFANNGTGKVNANSYPAFCRLAQIQTLIAPEKQVPAQRRLVEETILGNIAKDPQQVTEIGQLAGETMKKADQQKGGILLAGKITNIKTRDNMHGAIVSLAGSGQKVAIISGKPLNLKIDDEVLVTGVMVVNPAENLPGFTGTSPLVIWVGTIVPVPAVATDAK